MRALQQPFIALTALMAIAGTLPARAEPTADDKGRYTMTPVEGGFMRLDTETGAVAMCTRKADAWACEAVSDKTASGDDKAKIDAENKELKERIKALEDSMASGKPPSEGGYPSEPPGGISRLPTEEEVDKALDYVERMFKKLRDRVQKFETPSDTAPKTETPAKPGEGGSGAL